VRLLASGSTLLAGSVLADSAVEHYRGSFHNLMMVAPLVVSSLSVAANGSRALGHAVLSGRGTQFATIATGLIGLGFHVFDVASQPARFRLGNLFYAAPLGAPAALVLAGAIGLGAERVEGGLPQGFVRKAGILIAAGLLGTVAEVSLLHFRGAFHNRAMWLPIIVPPLAAASLAADAARAIPRERTVVLLGLTAALGLVGSALHAFGVARHMGGWRNWRQNVLAGPPIPAPPAFTGLALAGLGVLLMIGRKARG
jgi:hypothetical protein